jgi:hypothetical protein
MSGNFISAGVLPGGLYSSEDIRLLLCDLARQLAQPLSVAQAEEVFVREGLANYFEFHAALRGLTDTGHLLVRLEGGEATLALPTEFHRSAEELARELPRQARERALFAAEQLQRRGQRERENRITEYPTQEGGRYITFRQGEGAEMLLSVTVYAPDREEARRLRERFLEDPGKLYNAVIGALG